MESYHGTFISAYFHANWATFWTADEKSFISTFLIANDATNITTIHEAF
jgi:hypothetical protein